MAVVGATVEQRGKLRHRAIELLEELVRLRLAERIPERPGRRD
jgi:hypothetical protein